MQTYIEFENKRLQEFEDYIRFRKVAIIGLGVSNIPLIDYLYNKKANVTVFDNREIDELPKDIDVIYHTRIQAERFEGDFGKEEFIINEKVLNTFSDHTILMHPLPRVIEISTDVDNDPRACYF